MNTVEFYSLISTNLNCSNTLYGMKLNYLCYGQIISLSCINTISSVQVIFFDNNLDLINSNIHTQFTKCESIYGHSIIQNNSFYYIISDAICENNKRCYEPLDGELSPIEIINTSFIYKCNENGEVLSQDGNCILTCPNG